MPIRVLLLQARDAGDPMRPQEVGCFVAQSGLPPECIVPHDLLGGPPSLKALREHDAVMVGGSGDYYVSRSNLPEQERTLDFLREVVAVGHPTFASCFGYQLMVEALGGRIGHDPERTEVGTYELSLTGEGADDELFGHLPPRFQGQMGHKDRAFEQPPGVPNLVASELCPLQALRVPGRPIWASQFHPELSEQTNRERFVAYLEGYASFMTDAERAVALSRFHDSPEASSLLRRFVALVEG